MASSSCDIALVAEAHLCQQELLTSLADLRKVGWDGSGAPASLTCDNGTCAGTMALAKHHWHSKPLTNCIDQEGLLNPGSRLAGRVVTIKQCDILCLAGHLLSGGTIDCDVNFEVIQEVELLTCGGRRPFIWGLDANLTADKWGDSIHKWLRRLQAEIVLPENTSHTCRGAEGRPGTLIDYFIVSSSIRALICSCRALLDTPWGPHFGIELILSLDFDKVQTLQLVQPAKRKTNNTTLAEQAASDEVEASAASKSPATCKLEEPAEANTGLWLEVFHAAAMQSGDSPKLNKHQQAACTACTH